MPGKVVPWLPVATSTHLTIILRDFFKAAFSRLFCFFYLHLCAFAPLREIFLPFSVTHSSGVRPTPGLTFFPYIITLFYSDMIRSELEHRLATFQNHYALDKTEIAERDPISFHVTLTLKPNIPISERLILRFEEAIGGPLKSLVLLRSPATSTLLRFTVRRSAIDDETQADRVEEAASLAYARARIARVPDSSRGRDHATRRRRSPF